MAVRRWFAVRKRERVRDVWPILPGSERRPEGWPGWPCGKQFAFVLTHDVECQRGLDCAKRLAELEMSFGFRSAVNLIPEGPYSVPPALRLWLTDRGFEVGVHDLNHDGKLYTSQRTFAEKAKRINHHLKEWQAVGFRSGFMHHNLEWLKNLDVQYDASTFDTDPFEPQPDGVGTIFPFWVPRFSADSLNHPVRRSSPSEGGSSINHSYPLNSQQPVRRSQCGEGESSLNQARSGYVELPYTTAQDSTLFLILRERSIDVWKSKIDWVAKHGGMVLMNTHPDFMDLDGASTGSLKYPVSLYEAVLEYVRSNYSGVFWHALPKEVARFWRETVVSKSLSTALADSNPSWEPRPR